MVTFKSRCRVSAARDSFTNVRHPNLCRGRDSNPHALRHRLLRPAWLPVTPPRRGIRLPGEIRRLKDGRCAADRGAGREPGRLAAQASKTCVAASYTTPARNPTARRNWKVKGWPL